MFSSRFISHSFVSVTQSPSFLLSPYCTDIPYSHLLVVVVVVAYSSSSLLRAIPLFPPRDLSFTYASANFTLFHIHSAPAISHSPCFILSLLILVSLFPTFFPLTSPCLLPTTRTPVLPSCHVHIRSYVNARLCSFAFSCVLCLLCYMYYYRSVFIPLLPSGLTGKYQCVTTYNIAYIRTRLKCFALRWVKVSMKVRYIFTTNI